MKVAFRNEATGQVKFMKVGWSWTAFLFSGFLGIPLILRGLYAWAAVEIVLWETDVFLDVLPESEAAGMRIMLAATIIGLAIFFGIKANELGGKHHLENGWRFVEPASPEAELAREKWGLPTMVATVSQGASVKSA